MFNRFVMIVGVFLLCSSPVIAQHKIWVEADGSIYIQRGDNGIFGASILGKKEIKKNLFIGVGVTWLMSRLDASGTKVEDGVRYSMDASTVYRFAGKLTATWNIPVAFQSGFYVDGTLMADILPFDYAKLHRDVGDSKNHNRGKLLFTGFSPGAFIGGGIYHDFKRKKHPLRVSLGLQYGYFDFFYAYRHGRIYGQRLSSFVDTGRTWYGATIRFSSF